jgi:Fur family ferric uptake transcriptional regulator
MSCEENFFKQLRERGFRLTPQREIVLSVMHKMDGFATADEIYERVHAVTSSVDISTVYRTLGLLQEFRVVTSLDPGDGQRRYELLGLGGPHLHLICRSCGEVRGAELESARALADHLRDHYGFTADLARLSISGLCQACATGHNSRTVTSA